MRLAVSLLVLLVTGACASASNDLEPVDAAGDSDPGGLTPLPSGTDLELSLSDARYHLSTGCPAQDSVYLRIALTAPPSVDVEDLRVRVLELDGLPREDTLDAEGIRPMGAPDVLDAGTRGTFVVNLKPASRLDVCEDAETATQDLRDVLVELDVHGTRVELSGEIDVSCGFPAPHTC